MLASPDMNTDTEIQIPASSNHRQQSKYLPIWNSLKSKGVCRITAPIKYHKTIIRMVRGKRDDDIAYRMNLAEKNMVHRITTTINGTVIIFRLTEYATIYGL